MADGLRRLLDDESFRASCSTSASTLADRFRWSGVVAPLVHLMGEPGPWRAARARRVRDSGGGTVAGLWGPESPGTTMVAPPSVPVAPSAAAASVDEPVSPDQAAPLADPGTSPEVAAELDSLRAQLAASEEHLNAARRKLDWFSRTPIYPVYRILRRLAGTR